MGKKYKQIMSNIYVTTEMEDRIIKNIEKQDFSHQDKKVVKFISYRRNLVMAASVAFIIFGGITVSNMIKPDVAAPPIQSVLDVQTFKTIEELSEKAGFKISEVESLPFTPQQIKYNLYDETLAEIIYSTSENELVFRQARGTEDISGDYTDYNQESTLIVNNVEVTLKGNKEGYNLAVWKTNGFTYACYSNTGLSQDDWEVLIHNRN